MKAKQYITMSLAVLMAVGMVVPALAQEKGCDLQKADVHDRMLYHRAIEAVVWGMPLLNFKGFRDGLASVGVNYNDVSYHTKVQNWKFQVATPNDTTPYVNFYWTVKDGPVVVEIPASSEGVGIFGTLMDAWQRPLEDVGAKGKDGGLGAKYVMTPPGYDGELPAGAHVYEQRTYHGFAILRPIMAGGATPENLAKAAKFAKRIKVYPLAKADDQPATKYVDIYDKNVEMTPVLDGNVYAKLHEIIQEETIEEQNLAMMGLLRRIGIQKGVPFKPGAKAKAIYAAAAPEALQYMIEQYHRHLNPWMYEGKKWSVLNPPGVIRTGFTYEFPNHFDYHARGALYYAIISSVKTYGTATFYLDCAEDKDGNWLEGGNNYKLRVPPNVPARDFWSVVVYDLETAAWIREMSKVGIDSNRKDLVKNKDGSVDIYFGPKAPQGKEGNWIPTAPGRKFMLLFRFYGPEPAVFDGSFELNDVEKIK
jgi:hypothetical protein